MLKDTRKRKLTRKTLRTAENLSEFVTIVAEVRNKWFKNDDPWGPWFRGQQQASWGLTPKLLREYGSYKRIKG
jgi:hypothetical protein